MRYRRLFAGIALTVLIASCQLLPRYGDEAPSEAAPSVEAGSSADAEPSIALPTAEPPRGGPSPSIEVPPPLP
jgi:hypothetical protein